MCKSCDIVDWILIGWFFRSIKRQVAGMRILELAVVTIFLTNSQPTLHNFENNPNFNPKTPFSLP
jgi:hypothetical protein